MTLQNFAYMKRLSQEIIQFFQNQGFVIVSTLDKDKSLHSSCKGIVKINKNGKIYLLDLYKGRTFKNLKRNPRISITAVDEHRFKGYCLKGKARVVEQRRLAPSIIKAWEDKITSRITTRVLKNIHQDKSQPYHPEVFLPKPEYLIVVRVEEIINLTPGKMQEVK